MYLKEDLGKGDACVLNLTDPVCVSAGSTRHPATLGHFREEHMSLP